MIPVSLWLLATLDAAFAGYREAAGRNALINKRTYYCRAMLRGALYGQFAVAVTGLAILGLVASSNQRAFLIADLDKAAAHMLFVYIWYAALIMLAFLVRAIPSVDFRSLTSTVIFGPLTLIRPLVALGGIISGIAAAPGISVVLLSVLVLCLMLSLEWALGWARRQQQARL